MLIVLVLCAFLQTLQGASVPATHASSSVATGSMFSFMAREPPVAPDDAGQQFRTVYSILQSCLLTIFACVWTSAHPNINGPRDSGWTCFKRKVVTMLCAVLAPELVLYWALNQRSAAKKIVEKYNEEFARTRDKKTSLWRKVVGWFQPLPKATTRRGDGQLWTTTHAFFIQMGGFILYENEYPKEVLDYDRLAELLRDKAIDEPIVTERDLQDRSKGDAISKAIIVLQTTWFVFQCVTRAKQHLPLSELEVLTLAFAVLNVAIYAVWWDKPQGVGMAICVPLKRRTGKEVNGRTTPPMGEAPHELQSLSQTEPASLAHPDSRQSLMSDNLPLIPPREQERDESTGETHSWLRRMLQKDRERYSSPIFLLFRFPYRIVGSVVRPLNKIGDTNQIEKNDLRVPMFYAADVDSLSTFVASCVIGMIFGAIHLLAWASKFPLPRDLVLWRASAIVLTVVPFVMLSTWLIEFLKMSDLIPIVVLYLFVCLIPFYIAARFVLIIIALQAIRSPPNGVLLDVSWTSYIPHFEHKY